MLERFKLKKRKEQNTLIKGTGKRKTNKFKAVKKWRGKKNCRNMQIILDSNNT